MGFKLDNFGTEVANAKGTLGGICYYRYRNSEGDDLTTPGYFPALLGLNVGDRIYVIPQDASEADELWVITSIANRTVEAEKVSSGGGGGGVIEPLVVTPSTSAQTIEAPSGVDGFSPVNVDPVEATIDANIVAENIKNGVDILGVTGSYTGEAPTGTISITSNGTHNVSGYASANVAVPTSAPALYRSFVNQDGMLNPNPNETSIINFSGITKLYDYLLYKAYDGNTAISGTIDMSDVEEIANDALTYCFSNCPNITSVDLTSLKLFASGGSYAFSNSGLTTAGLPNVEQIYGAYSLFSDTALTTISLPKCYLLTDSSGMFYNITTLLSADLSAAVFMDWVYDMFYECTSLASVDLSSVALINGTRMFSGTALTSVSFPSFAPATQWYTERPDAFMDMFYGVSNITLHFPSNVQTIVESFNGYSATEPFGATSGSVLFDLPATYAIEDQYGFLVVRCPVKDTASALGWFNAGTNQVFWTAGTSQPSINDVFYADSDLTRPSGNIVNAILS